MSFHWPNVVTFILNVHLSHDDVACHGECVAGRCPRNPSKDRGNVEDDLAHVTVVDNQRQKEGEVQCHRHDLQVIFEALISAHQLDFDYSTWY